jgi:hypothetical protein
MRNFGIWINAKSDWLRYPYPYPPFSWIVRTFPSVEAAAAHLLLMEFVDSTDATVAKSAYVAEVSNRTAAEGVYPVPTAGAKQTS